MKVKRLIATGFAIAVLGTCSGCSLLTDSPYSYKNPVYKNVSFFHSEDNNFTDQMEDFFDNDFKSFEKIMRKLQKGNYNKCTSYDIEDLDDYMDIILSCNFRGYKPEKWRHSVQGQSGFVIEFENYFPEGSQGRELVEKFSGYFENLIAVGYNCSRDYVEEIVKNCTTDYHIYESQIYNLPVFPKYIVLKIVRPIIAANDSQYVIAKSHRYHGHEDIFYDQYSTDKTLRKIDEEINKCLTEMREQCSEYGFIFR